MSQRSEACNPSQFQNEVKNRNELNWNLFNWNGFICSCSSVFKSISESSFGVLYTTVLK